MVRCLGFCNIGDISPLAGLTHLTDLYVWGNNLTDISPLIWLTDLTTLHLNDNNISDISPLAGLTHLTDLELYSNSISDISPLVSNSGIDSGDSVDIHDTPLDCDDAATQDYISTLEERGVILTHDCP